jgi:hypothetical protein
MIQRLSKVLISAVFFILFLPQLAWGAGTLYNAFGTDGPLDKAAGANGAGYNTDTFKVETVIGLVIQTFLSIIGVIFLILMIYAGYSWMTAHGDEQKVTKAKETITASIIGLAIVIGAYAITFFVISKLTDTTLTSS